MCTWLEKTYKPLQRGPHMLVHGRLLYTLTSVLSICIHFVFHMYVT